MRSIKIQKHKQEVGQESPLSWVRTLYPDLRPDFLASIVVI